MSEPAAKAWFRGALSRARATWLGVLACVAFVAGTSVVIAWAAGPLFQALSGGGDASAGAQLFGGLLIAAVVARSGASFLQALLAERLKQRVALELRETLFARLLGAPSDDAAQSGGRADLAARLGGDVEQIENLAYAITVGLVSSALTVIALGIFAATIDPLLAGLALAALLPLIWVVSRISRHVRRGYRATWQSRGALTGHIAEVLSLLPVVQAFGAADKMQASFEARARKLHDLALRAAKLRALVPPIMSILGVVALVGVVVVATGRLDAGHLGAESYVSFLAALLLIYRPVTAFGAQLAQVAAGLGALDRVGPILALDDAGEVAIDDDANGEGDLVEVEAIGFAYGDRPVLGDVSLRIAAGESLAIIGESGSGKSTLLRILAGVLPQDDGHIRIGGAAASSAILRRHFAWVPQEPRLLSGSVADNIALADERPDPERLAEAVKSAGLTRLAERLGKDMDAVLSEGGEDLSVGERQRVCIARALYSDAPLLLLDEPTAALDGRAEADLSGTISALVGGRGVVVASHRRSTVERADRVVILEGGRIVEEGTPTELAANSARYATLLIGASGAPERKALEAV